MNNSPKLHKYEQLRYELNSQTRGTYAPSFFKLGVNTGKDLNHLDQLDIKSFSIFIHEYIHFLQDITTSFGLVNINIIVDKMKYFNNDILGKNVHEFRVPL